MSNLLTFVQAVRNQTPMRYRRGDMAEKDQKEFPARKPEHPIEIFALAYGLTER